MTLIPRDTWLDLDRVFDAFFAPAAPLRQEAGFFAPRVDIHDCNDHFEITAELPGVKKEDLSVRLDNGVLTIEASTGDEKTEQKDGRVIRKERRSGRYMRSFTLSPSIRDADIDAGFENGVLTLKVPKQKPEEPKTRNIAVK